MASKLSTPAGSTTRAQVVGKAFVYQYFNILHQSPELVHQFYQENSRLGRPGAQGEMNTTSSMLEINNKILSMDYIDYRAQIKTVDSQESLNGGFVVLVTGYLIRKDNVKRDFTQTFFLATQDKGYYVLNDIFRYVEEADQQQEQRDLLCESDAPLSVQDGAIPHHEYHALDQTDSVLEDDEVNQEEVYNPSELDEESTVGEEEPVDEVINEVPIPLLSIAESCSSIGQEKKMSYASIVRVMKENSVPVSVAASSLIRAVPSDIELQASAAPIMTSAITSPPVTESSGPGSYSVESSFAQKSAGLLMLFMGLLFAFFTYINSHVFSSVDSYSIYVKNLPLDTTNIQLEEAFQKFGLIKPNGVQVRSNKLQGFCFGFVEFEAASAVQTTLEASPVVIGGRQAYVEEKRAIGSRVKNRGRFASGRGGFRGDEMRGSGSFLGGRGYGRGGEYNNNRPDFGNRGGSRGTNLCGGDVGYQRVNHMNSSAPSGSRRS